MMKTYRCHKKVEAFLIESIDTLPYGAVLRGREPNSSIAVAVNARYVRTHCPAVGGYYTVDASGNEGWVTKELFEADYSVYNARPEGPLPRGED
jgi:hypothetical protein